VPYGICPYIVDEFSSEVYDFGVMCLHDRNLKTSNIIQHTLLLATLSTKYSAPCKSKGLDTCYSAAYMSKTRDQQRFTISEVAAQRHDPVVPQCIMWPSISRANGQLDPRCS